MPASSDSSARSLLTPPRPESEGADYWRSLGLAIAHAGGWYAVVFGGGAMLVTYGTELLQTLLAGPSLTQLAYAFANLPLTLLAGPFVFMGGFITVGIVVLAVLPIVALTLRLLGERPPRDAIGAFCGAVVGFVTTLPLWLTLAERIGAMPVTEAVVFYAGVVVALAFGQVAGLLASPRAVRRRRRGRLHPTPFRFTMWRALAAMVPLSLGLTLLRAAGLLTAPMALATLSALTTAWALRRPLARGVNRWLDRRARLRRAARST